jgi:gliding motility-associated-like protein
MNKKLLSVFAFALSYTFCAAQLSDKNYFFKGDSLNGFDVAANYAQLLKAHYSGVDLNAVLAKKEKEFVNQKYHLKVIPVVEERSAIISIPSKLTSTCNNLDFETGDSTGWKGATGINRNSATALTIRANGFNTLGNNSAENSCSIHTIVSSGTDPYTGLPMVDPGGGTFAARLGGEWMNICSSAFNGPGGPSVCTSGRPNQGPGVGYSGGEVLQQTFIVTPANGLFTYKYAVVMDSAAHPAGDEPYFRLEVLDSAGNPIPCQQYYVEADPNGGIPAGFIASSRLDTNLVNTPAGGPPVPVYYKPWTTNSVNLSLYLGHPVTVRFTAAGCTFGGHFCYAYIDATCGAISINAIHTSPIVCIGMKDTLVAPPNGGGIGKYTWSTLPSGTAGIVGADTNQFVVVNASGTYEVLVTQSNGCQYKLDTTITFHPTPVPTISSKNISCNGLNNGSAVVSVASGTKPFTYSWNPAPGTGQATDSVTGLSPGTYTVLVTASTGCAASTTIAITQPTLLTVTDTVVNVACNGGTGSATARPSGGSPTYSYSWTPSGGNGPGASGILAGTYTSTITDSHGCTATAIANVTQPTVLNTTNNPTAILCHGASTGADTVLATGGTLGYSYSWSPFGGTASKATGLTAGTYTCTVTDAHNCVTTATAIITEPAALVLATSSVPTPCAGVSGSATVTPSGGTGAYTYSWSPVSGSTPTITAATSGIYSVTVTDANNCVQNAAIPVQNTGGPIGTIHATVPVTCFAGTDGSAYVSGTGGTGTLTYSWSPAGGNGIHDTIVSGLAAGNYLIAIVDGTGCQTIMADTILQPKLITGTVVQTNVSCFSGNNGSAVLTATGGNPGGYTYVWTPTGGTTFTGSNLSFGTYTCTITDTKSCIGTEVVSISQPTLLTASHSIVAATCFGTATGDAIAAGSGGTTPYTYSWSPLGGATANATGLNAGLYTCTVTDAKGCQTTTVANITQPTAVSSTITPTRVACNGGITGSAVVVPTGGTPSYAYSWSPSGGTGATAPGLAAGTYTCTITDANGCPFAIQTTVTQPFVLAATDTLIMVTCNGANDGKITARPTGGTTAYSYSWQPSGGTLATATGLAPGTYTCNITDANGCATLASGTITQPPVITALIRPIRIDCFGGTNGVDSVLAAGGTGAFTYSWNPGNSTSYIATGLSAQTYTCTVMDANGCTVVRTVTLTQHSQITGNPNSTPAVCLAINGTATINANGGVRPYTYSWSPIAGTSANETGLAVGSYTCTITDNLGCNIQVPVSVAPGTSTIVGNPTSTQAVCLSNNGSATVNPSGGNGAYTFSWTTGGSSSTTNSISGLAVGGYTCNITDAFGCTAQVPVSVSHGTGSLVAAFSPNVSTGLAPLTVVFTDHSTGGATSWSWSFGEGTVVAGANTTFDYTTPGTYTVTETVTDINGCDNTTTEVIVVKEPLSTLEMPNVFSPNGDGKNDFYELKYTSIKDFDMKIYDRWGVEMFHSITPASSWDGKSPSGLTRDGTYYYVVTAVGNDSKKYNLSGFLMLIR